MMYFIRIECFVPLSGFMIALRFITKKLKHVASNKNKFITEQNHIQNTTHYVHAEQKLSISTQRLPSDSNHSTHWHTISS